MKKNLSSAISVLLAVLIIASSALCGVAVNGAETDVTEPTSVIDVTETTAEEATEVPSQEETTEPSTEESTTEAPSQEETTDPSTEETTEAPSEEETTEPSTEVTTEAPSEEVTTEPATDESTTEEPTTEPEPVEPVVPGNVDFTVKSTKYGVVLTWKDNLSDIDYENAVNKAYYIYRKTSGGSWKLLMIVNDKLEYTDSNVKYGETYYYTIRACYYIEGEKISGTYDKAGTSVKVKYVPKATMFQVEPYSGKYIKITWNKTIGATKYALYRATEPDGKYTKLYAGTSRKYVDKTATPGATYYYKVKAYTGSKAGLASDYMSYTFKVGMTKLKYPLTSNETAIKLQWSKVKGADGYVIYRKTSGESWKKIKTIKSGDTTSYVNKGISGKYFYAIKAYHTENGKNVYGALSEQTAVRTLAKVKTIKVSVDKNNYINTVKWSKVSGAAGYQLYAKISGENWELVATTGKSERSFSHSVTRNTTYYYKVRPIYCSSVASFSKTVSAKVTWVPDYTVTLPSNNYKNKAYITVKVKNNSKSDMYIYSDGACYISGENTFETPISKAVNKNYVDYIKISAGKTATFYLNLPTSLISYNTEYFVGFMFKQGDNYFVTASSYKYGTETVFLGKLV